MTRPSKIAFAKVDLTAQLIASLINDVDTNVGEVPDKEWKKAWLKGKLIDSIWSVYGEDKAFRQALAEDLKEELHVCFLESGKDDQAEKILLKAFRLKVDFWFKNLKKEAV